jgi:two-component system nitrate/nitrite response regulator NarL
MRKPPAVPDKSDDAVPHRQAVVVVDRNLLFRAGLIHALERSRFDVLAESSSLEDVPFGRLTVGQPILLLIGLESARTGTVPPALRDWRRRYNRLTVIILSDHNWAESLPSDRAEIRDVVDALLPKESVGSESISNAVDLVLLGMSVMPQEFLRHAGFNGAAATALAPRKQERIAGSGAVHLSIDSEQCAAVSLTVREKLILSHLTNGDSNKHIARAIGIAEPTVKIHVRNLMRKTDTRNRTQAAMWGKKIRSDPVPG